MVKNTLKAAQDGKDLLRARYGQAPWYRGVGIAPSGAGFAVRLNVAPSFPEAAEFPTEVDGVPVEIVRIESYSPR